MDNLHALAYSLLPNMTTEIVMEIEKRGVEGSDFFTMGTSALSSRLGISETIIPRIDERENALRHAEKEYEFARKHNISVRGICDEGYPTRLSHCPDAPLCVHMLGGTNVDADKVIGIVGTRRVTPYGLSFIRTFCREISEMFPGAIIVSGLALGVDSAAHNGALENGLPTVGVLAHGLNTIYPADNRGLAMQMLNHGGMLVTEYPTGTRPYKGNFLQRNRIIAGMSDAVVVVESDIRGGSLSTANHAFRYDREVFALPGRYTDTYSRGCNELIARQKAQILTSAEDMAKFMGWISEAPGRDAVQPSLFPDLNPEQQKIVEALREEEGPMTPDRLMVKTELGIREINIALADLEFDGIVAKYPGNCYGLL